MTPVLLRFRDVLGAKDRDHVRLILNSSISTDKSGLQELSKVNEFLRDDTYIAEDAVEAFKGLAQADRERMISELIWRITCHLDKSITRFFGVHTYPLGKDFSAVQSEKEGRNIFCLAVAGG